MSANATPVPPFEFSQKGTFDAPYTYEVPASGEVQPYSATATWDGTGAGGAFQPTISIYSANVNLLARVFPEGVTMQPGDVAEVTFIPPFGSAASSGGGGGGITEVDSPDGSITVTNPTGPTVDVELADGAIQYQKDNEGEWLDIGITSQDANGWGTFIHTDASTFPGDVPGLLRVQAQGEPTSSATVKAISASADNAGSGGGAVGIQANAFANATGAATGVAGVVSGPQGVALDADTSAVSTDAKAGLVTDAPVLFVGATNPTTIAFSAVEAQLYLKDVGGGQHSLIARIGTTEVALVTA